VFAILAAGYCGGGVVVGADKLSISLPHSLVAFVEQYRIEHGFKTRSGVIAKALKSLKENSAVTAPTNVDAQDWDVVTLDDESGAPPGEIVLRKSASPQSSPPTSRTIRAATFATAGVFALLYLRKIKWRLTLCVD
jgi:antitoxin ParD1/3/4